MSSGIGRRVDMQTFIVAYVSKGRSTFFFNGSGFGLGYVRKLWISSNTKFLRRTTQCSIRPVETRSRPGTPVTYVFIGHEAHQKRRWLPVDTVSYPRTVESSFIVIITRDCQSVLSHVNSGDILTLCFFKIRFNIIFSSLKRSVCLVMSSDGKRLWVLR